MPTADADDEREPARRAELAQQVPELLEEVALALLDAEELRQLPDHDRQGEADDESLHHRLGDEAREEAEAEEPRDQSRDRDGERHRDRELDEQVRVLAGEIADGSRRQRPHKERCCEERGSAGPAHGVPRYQGSPISREHSTVI